MTDGLKLAKILLAHFFRHEAESKIQFLESSAKFVKSEKEENRCGVILMLIAGVGKGGKQTNKQKNQALNSKKTFKIHSAFERHKVQKSIIWEKESSCHKKFL